MSLLNTKSWNPRSAKNRAKVEAAERQKAEADRQAHAQAQAMDSEWRFERLKAKVSSNGHIATASDHEHSSTIHSKNENELGKLEPSATTSPEPSSLQKTLKASGTPLGGTSATRMTKPWYTIQDYDLTASAKPDSVLEAKARARDDPMSLMEASSSRKKSSSSCSTDYKNKSYRVDLLSGAGPNEKLAQLRQERLQREAQERAKAAKLTSSSHRQRGHGYKGSSYGPVRGPE